MQRISGGPTFGKHPKCFQVLDDVAGLVGHEQEEEVLDRLIHVSDGVRLDEGVLLVACSHHGRKKAQPRVGHDQGKARKR